MPKMGLEGIVSKRKDSTYRSGRSPDWFKIITELDLHDRSGQTLPLALVPVRVVLDHEFYQGRDQTHGYEATREAAIQAFAKCWHRETY